MKNLDMYHFIPYLSTTLLVAIATTLFKQEKQKHTPFVDDNLLFFNAT